MVIHALVDGLTGKNLHAVPIHLFALLSPPLLNHVVFRWIETRPRRLRLEPVHPSQKIFIELHFGNILK